MGSADSDGNGTVPDDYQPVRAGRVAGASNNAAGTEKEDRAEHNPERQARKRKDCCQ